MTITTDYTGLKVASVGIKSYNLLTQQTTKNKGDCKMTISKTGLKKLSLKVNMKSLDAIDNAESSIDDEIEFTFEPTTGQYVGKYVINVDSENQSLHMRLTTGISGKGQDQYVCEFTSQWCTPKDKRSHDENAATRAIVDSVDTWIKMVRKFSVVFKDYKNLCADLESILDRTVQINIDEKSGTVDFVIRLVHGGAVNFLTSTEDDKVRFCAHGKNVSTDLDTFKKYLDIQDTFESELEPEEGDPDLEEAIGGAIDDHNKAVTDAEDLEAMTA